MSLPLILSFIFLCRFPKSKSVPSVLKSRYDQTAVHDFRKLESIAYKLLKHKNDVEFLLKCREADLVPVFLQYKLANNRMKNSPGVRRDRQRLLWLEIVWHRKCITKLSSQHSQMSAKMKGYMRRIDLVFLTQYIDKGSETYVSKVHTKH